MVRDEWHVWRVTYGTYEEVARDGDKEQELVESWLSFKEAAALVEKLGFGYCMKPARMI